MEETRNELTVIISREFSRAVQQQDAQEIRRYFKLFPMLSQTKKGLQLYSDFLCDMLAERFKQQLSSSSL